MHHRRRLALTAANPLAGFDDILLAFNELLSSGGNTPRLEIGTENGLASFWYQKLLEHREKIKPPPEVMDQLRQRRWIDVGLYMAQRSFLDELDQLFEAAGITYAVFKGAHVREVCYSDPSFRPANDIDVLVSPTQRVQAIETLTRVGFTLKVEPNNVSHELSLLRGPVVVDLHWDILRPGRTREPICEDFLRRRKRVAGFWGLGDTDAIFVMLVHPAFSRYVSNLALSNVLDLVYWQRSTPSEWKEVESLLDAAGVKTAAWTVLTWMSLLLPAHQLGSPDDFMLRIKPGTVRRVYLDQWVRHDLPIRFWDAPLLNRVGFTLFLHDTLTDSCRALLKRVGTGLSMNRADFSEAVWFESGSDLGGLLRARTISGLGLGRWTWQK